MFCTKCGKQLPEGSAFCFACGNPVAAPAAPAQPVQAPAAPAAPAQPVQAPAAPAAPAQPVQTPAAPATPAQPVQTPAAPVAPAQPVQTPAAPATPAQPVQTPAAPVAPVTPVRTVPAPVTPVYPTAMAEEASADATTALTPDQAPGYMAPATEPPAQPVYQQPAEATQPVSPSPAYPTPAAPQPAPKGRNNVLILGIIAIVAVIALTLGALWAVGAFDDLFGNSVSDDEDKDNDKNKDKNNDGDDDDDDDNDGGDNDGIPSKSTTGRVDAEANSSRIPGQADAQATTTTQEPIESPTTTQTGIGSVTLSYTAGYISGDTYYNHWANLMYGIEEGWENGTADEYATYEDGVTDCGLYIKRIDESAGIYDVVNIVFEESTVSSDFYMDNVRNALDTQFAAQGITCDWSEVVTTGLAGRYWQSVSVSMSNGVYQRYLVTEQDGHIIAVVITSLDSSNLNSLLYNLVAIS